MSSVEVCAVPCYKEDIVLRLQAALPPEGLLQDMARMLGLLGDVTRLRILVALSDGEELCVCDVANVVGLSLSATSHQLRRLRDAGAVTHRNDGRMVYYQLRDGSLARLARQARAEAEGNCRPEGAAATTVQAR